MDLYAKHTEVDANGSRWYAIFDMEEAKYPIATLEVWSNGVRQWGFTVRGQEFGDVVSEHELVKSHENEYAVSAAWAKAAALVALKAHYMSDPDTIS